ncbi:pre-tRNA nuclear export protein [Marasmius oreades]|uniref:Exportin-T n=1 Tax=Marasmius oreades TaxID=181124 RepID=A0A9P7RUG5_9AGAR|nr:pre-tRNA nuclear export protein [Marasmius oreades]KAG7089605.1 pre-tRNA nuclear export protein [Marasmius oreades]
MDQEIEQVVQAITIASDPSQSSLHQEAIGYLSTIQQNASEAWRIALHLFVDLNADGTRRYTPQARFFALRVLDEYLDNRFEPFDPESFQTLQQALLSYVQSEYLYGQSEANAAYIRNKFSHTLTLFFLCTYMDQWPTFFADLFSLIQPADSSQPSFNRHISLLFFHIILEISGEVADQMIKSARQFSTQRHARDARVRDAVRERDAVRINEAVLTIVSATAEKMTSLQKQQDGSAGELSEVEEVVDWGIRAFGSYVGWIDINLTVTPTTVPLLFNLLADRSLPIRLATSAALLRIVAKGLKEPGDKLQLLKVLSLGQVIDALETKTRQQQVERGGDTDEGEESYREALGKLLNVLGLELIKLEESQNATEEVRSETLKYIIQILPVLLRFLADEYDDTCSTVFPFLQTVLSGYKRTRKTSTGPIDTEKRSFLTSLLQVILEKMKWEIDASPDDPEDDDSLEFEKIRKDLRTFMDSVLIIDQDLVTDAVKNLAFSTIEAYKNQVDMKWNEAELAVHLVYIFGEINKSGGKGRAAFCLAPSVRDKEGSKNINYADYPLTTHGELLLALVQSGISAYPHQAVALQFFEAVSRYGDFFKVRKECIVPVLEAMIDSRGIHNQNSGYRSRLYYLFYRFIKEERNDIPPEVSATIAESLRDLLAIQVELPSPDDVEVDVLTDAVKSSAFDAQLYLFETIGILCSLLFKNPEQMKSLLLSFVKPLMDELSEALQAYTKNNQDIGPVAKLHHLVMALGNIAKGFPDYPSPVPPGYILPPLDVFAEVAQAMLVCLENMNVYKPARDATRFAFARILATAGSTITHFIPPLMSNLLIHFEPSELVDFMNFIALLIFRLRDDMFDVLDQLVGPLTAHISATQNEPVSGSDEERTHSDTKKAYLALLTSIMTVRLHGVFISPRNNPSFDSLMETMRMLAEDTSDPPNQKAAFTFLSRCVTAWAQPQQATTPNGNSNHNPLNDMALPGFEGYIYERLVPSAFRVPSNPSLNLKDGQVTVVLHEIANFLQTVCVSRGEEAYNWFLNVFLPSQNWPSDAAMQFVTKLRELDSRSFRKYFTDFVRSSRS